MRIRVTWPGGKQRDVLIRTWDDLYEFVAQHKEEGRRAVVEPDDGGFRVTVRGE